MTTVAEVLNEAFAHHRAGDLARAEQLYVKVLEADPRQSDAWNGVGVMAQQLGRHELAIQYFDRAISIDATHGSYFSNRGVALHDLGRFDEAALSHQRALQLNGNDPAAYNNLSIVLRDLGRLDEARVCCQHALRLKPDYAEAHNNLGNVLKDQNQFAPALACYQQAVSLNPRYAPGFNNLGVLYRELGLIDEARKAFAQSNVLEPDAGLRLKSMLLMPIVPDSLEQISRERARLTGEAQQLMTEPLELVNPAIKVGMTVFYTAYHGLDDTALQRQLGELFLHAAPSLAYVAPHCRAERPLRRGRLRIGFLSKFFHEHTIAKLTAGIARNLSREKFEVVLFRFPGNEDRWAEFMRQSADHSVVLSPRIEQAREQVAACELDLLFYPDLGMDPLTYFLAFSRLAPVQCVTWGHPVTTGIPSIDVFLSSRLLEPEEGAAHYNERLLLLENLPTFYYRPERPHASGTTRAAFGLPEGVPLYLCPQSLFKLHPDFDRVMAGILRADQHGKIVLLAGQQPEWTEQLLARLRRTMPEMLDRILFVGRQPAPLFIELLAHVDVILDPLHFSGGNTSYEAFAVGTPIVTCPGPFMRSRVTAALYRQMGVEDCVASSSEHYVELAVRLAGDAAWREQMRERIRASNHRLYENTALVRELEELFESLVAETSGR